MSKRNALRPGLNPHDGADVAFTVDRYGKIEPETLAEIVTWLEAHTDEYEFSVGEEFLETEFGSIGDSHPIIKTRRKSSAIYKIIDNEHDAQNTLANIRNPNFPKNKQGQ